MVKVVTPHTRINTLLKNQILELLIDEIDRRGLNLSNKKRDQIEKIKQKLINSVIEKQPNIINISQICSSNYVVLPLTAAICQRDDDLVNKLIKNGANVNLVHDLQQPDNSRQSPESPESQSPEKDSKNTVYKNISPLHIASKFGTFESIKLLVSNGANVNAITEKGDEQYTPLDFVPTEEGLIETSEEGFLDYRYRNNKKIRDFLIAQGEKPAA